MHAAERLAQMDAAFLALAVVAVVAYVRQETRFRETAVLALIGLSMAFAAFLCASVLA